MTGKLKILLGILAVIIVVPLAFLAYRHFYVDCSQYDYRQSWAWGGSGNDERRQCENAGCELVEAYTFDDPSSLDEEYTDFRCVRRNETSPMTLDEFENREVIKPETWDDCDRLSKTKAIGCNLPRTLEEYDRNQDNRTCAKLAQYDYCIDRMLSHGAKAPWDKWNPSYCDTVSDTEIAEECRYYAGLYGQDISSCDMLDDSDPDKEHCYRVIAYKTGDRELCARLTHEPSRQSCELMCNPTAGCELPDHYCAWSSVTNHHVCIPKDRSRCGELLIDQLVIMCETLCDPGVGCENPDENCVMNSIFGHEACVKVD